MGLKTGFGSDCDVIGGHKNVENMDHFEVDYARGHNSLRIWDNIGQFKVFLKEKVTENHRESCEFLEF